ncbi:hypothetical protein N658DRAFT_480080 [Parathielavia hyrcaniae]|uniref:Uncharacterized protein n=1 Tax=Parathielavia hyrcaniae TaxID=113614 RepID=A0AAN6SXT5_9PEZI|nr:hypothetical protein N658DRAFT_480080 [Parathielavia hyrcaniae]
MASGMTDPAASRAVFDSLLAKTHVQHALIQGGDRHNELPTALATVFFLDAGPDRLQATYDSMKGSIAPWKPSPGSIADEETKEQFLGDVRFQRAFMTYFSMENSRFAGNAKALALAHIFTGPKPLLHGLFSGLGRPLTLLSDGIELRNAILVMQALTLSAVSDWAAEPVFSNLLLLPPNNPHTPPPTLLPPVNPNPPTPETLLNQLAYDSRLSSAATRLSGPGFHPPALSQLLSQSSNFQTPSSPAVAIDEYVRRLDTTTTKSSDPAQLRPVVDGRLLASRELAGERRGWDEMMEVVRGRGGGEDGGVGDLHLLRVLRSLRELSKAYGAVHGRLYFHAAWKLVRQWQAWTGLGVDREVSLNIRL